MRILDETGPTPDVGAWSTHVALPDVATDRPRVRAAQHDRVGRRRHRGRRRVGWSRQPRRPRGVRGAARPAPTACSSGSGTVVAEQYRVPDPPHLQLYVVADTTDVSGARRALRVGPGDARAPRRAPGPCPTACPSSGRATASSSTSPWCSPRWRVRSLVAEGGPTLAGLLVAQGLLDEFFVTIAPRVIAGDSARVAHGPDADAVALEPRARLRRRRRVPLPPLRAPLTRHEPWTLSSISVPLIGFLLG